jgi:hypothetical protein
MTVRTRMHLDLWDPGLQNVCRNNRHSLLWLHEGWRPGAVLVVSIAVVVWEVLPCKAMVSCASSSAVSWGKSNRSHKSDSESEVWSVVLSVVLSTSSSESMLELSVPVVVSESSSVSASSCVSER